MTEPTADLDVQLQRRIEAAVRTVRAWDADIDLLAECRRQIPLATLRAPPRPTDEHYATDVALTPTARFVQRLARYFKAKMTWVNQPPCRRCGQTEHMKHQGARGPVTREEHEGEAQRVEVYQCTVCTVETTFPRYNSVRKLLQTHAGRCGEYANLFGLYCRSLGLDARYVLDLTDHVWTEVRFMSDEVPSVSAIETTDEPWWCMIDSCEGVMDEPSMYEVGWGKQLSLMVAVSTTAAVDVTPKYTRQLSTLDLQARRRAFSTSEAALVHVVERVNATLLHTVPSKEQSRSQASRAIELAQLQRLAGLTVWNDRQQTYRLGRISGSLDWKLSRHEAGRRATDTDAVTHQSQSHESTRWMVEAFYPCRGPSCDIVVAPSAPHSYRIVVNGVDCGVSNESGLAVVVLDEVHWGCILQSRSVSSLRALAYFIETVPAHRIVIVVGRLSSAQSDNEPLRALSELGGFQQQHVDDGIVYVGQVLAHPDWTYCASYKDTVAGVSLCLNAESANMPLQASQLNDCKLWIAKGIRPKSVVGRLSDAAMPLEQQLEATFAQKRQAFQSHLNTEGISSYYGFTTRTGAPIYLLGESAYPFKKSADGWHTCLRLPSGLVDDSDEISGLDVVSPSTRQFEVPLDVGFFTQHLGDRLLLNGTTNLPTTEILHNTRLVGLYFSAHWCPPCRKFTPVLSELYSVLKQSYPIHGLEIVFVSSDRDAASFASYFASMPWLAIPFEALAEFKPPLSAMYNVNGIPSLVILDSMSGQVVVPNQEARQHIMQACQSGDDAIKSMFESSWLNSVPAESIQLLELLSSSCQPDHDADSSTLERSLRKDYLVRAEYTERESRIQSLMSDFMAEGMERDEATDAALAVEDVSAEDPGDLDGGPLNGAFHHAPEAISSAPGILWQDMDIDDGALVRSTASKYLSNCLASPWTVKYRHIRLGFKAADKITRAGGALKLLQALGFQVYSVTDDYVACIPVYADLEEMSKEFAKLTSNLSTAR